MCQICYFLKTRIPAKFPDFNKEITTYLEKNLVELQFSKEPNQNVILNLTHPNVSLLST